MDHPIKQRSWFPFILVGLTMALAAGVWAWQAGESGRPSVDQVNESSHIAPTSILYKRVVYQVVSTYLEDGDAERAYETLIDLWVPADDKSVHLDLVIVFGKLADGDVSAQEALDTIRSSNSWLP